VPGYEVLGELGRGGMGVVYKARQVRLGRVVALKVLLAGGHAGAQDLARFRAEASAAARLQHPNVVQVYEVGEEGGRPYLALEYVDGGSLAEKLRGTPLPAREAAQLAETLARAVHAAHRHGIVHRDLKPANVLLTADGTPKIVDFGLAKRLDGTTLHTQTGAVLGTPDFMAPEQAEGKATGPAADVHALGALLYQMLTGRPPFVAETALDTLLRVRLDEPVPPSVLQPKVPRDLGTVCLRCLRKSPAQRYASALDLAEDLRRFLDGEPVRARPVSSWERAGKWIKRRPALAALAAAIVLTALALVGSLGALWQDAEARARAVRQLDEAQRTLAERQGQLRQLEEGIKEQQGIAARTRAELEEGIKEQQDVAARTRAEVERLQKALPEEQARAREARLTTRRALYIRDLHLAQAALDKGQVDRLVMLLGKHRPPPGAEDVRGFEWHVLWRLGHGERALLRGHPGCYVRALQFSPDGQTLASAAAWSDPYHTGRTSGTGEEGLKLWDVATGAERALPRKEVEKVVAVAYSPDGQTLAVGRRDGRVELWDVAEGRPRTSFRALAAAVLALAFAPDGRTLATGAPGGDVKLWDLPGPRERARLPGHRGDADLARFAPDGRALVTAGGSETARLWDVTSGRERLALRAQGGTLLVNVNFSPDGGTLATSEAYPFSPHLTGYVRLWDTATGEEDLPALEVPNGGAWATAFTPDGRFLAVSDNFGVVKFWDVAARKVRRMFLGHTERLHAIAFSPDGKTMATGGNDGTVRLWDVAAPPELPVTLRESAGRTDFWVGTGVAFAPDGTTLAARDAAGNVRLLDRKTGRERTFLSPHGGELDTLSFSPDARTIATAGKDGMVRLWDVATRTERAALQGHAVRVTGLAFAPDGKTLASGGRDGWIKLWDPASGKDLGTLPGPGSVLAFSPDGRRLASGSAGEAVRLWDLATRQPLAVVKVPPGGVTLAFSPDGHLLAAGTYGGSVMLWDVAALDRRLPAEAASAVALGGVSPVALALPAIALAPRRGDQDLLASLPYSGGGHAFQLAFTPDGKTLVSSHGEHGLVFWDVATRQERFVLRGPPEITVSVALSPDGELLATGDGDGSVYLWDIREDPEQRWVFLPDPAAPEQELARHRRAAEEAERAGQWFAAAWHLDRLLRQEPDSASLRARRDRALAPREAGLELRPAADLRGHGNPVSSVAFDPRCGRLASGGLDQTVKVWEPTTGKPLLSLTGHTHEVWSVAFSPDGQRLASASSTLGKPDLPGEIILWEAATGKPLFTLASPTGGVHGVAFSPDGQRLASVGFDRAVRLWDTSSGKERRAIPGHTAELRGVAFSPDGKLVASAGFDKAVRLWDADSGAPVRTLGGHTDVVWSVAFSPDGKRLVSASDDLTVRVWDVATGTVVHVLRGHTISPYGAVFSPDGRRIASASGDRWELDHSGEVLVWDAETGKRLAAVPSATSGFFGVAFSPDGKQLAAAGMDASVKRWDAGR
jgi:WD40 repeat protein/predicted Ser/Thr protein kinase